MLFAISYDQTSKIDKRIIMKKIKSLLIKNFSFFRKVTLVLYVLGVSFNGMIGQSGYSSVRHYYGVEPFANEALMSQSCRIQNTVKEAMINPTDEFNVYGYDYFPVLNQESNQPYRAIYKKDLDTLYTRPAFMAVFRFFRDTLIKYRVHLKLPLLLKVTLNAAQIYYLENYLKEKLEGIVPEGNEYRQAEINALSSFNEELTKYLSGNGTVSTDLTRWIKFDMPSDLKVIVENGTPCGNSRINETNNIIKFLVNGKKRELFTEDLKNNDSTFTIGSIEFDIFYSLRTSLDTSAFVNPRAERRSYMNFFAQKQDKSKYYDLFYKVETEIDDETSDLVLDSLIKN